MGLEYIYIIYIYINHSFHRLTEQVNGLWTGFHKRRVLTENYLRTENSIIIIPTLLCGLYLCLHLLMISVRLFKISCLCSAIVSFLFTTDVLMEFSTIYQHFCFVLLVLIGKFSAVVYFLFLVCVLWFELSLTYAVVNFVSTILCQRCYICLIQKVISTTFVV